MRIAVVIGICLVGLADPAQAQLSKSDGNVFATADLAYRHFEYVEYGDSGTVLDRETGELPGIVLRAGKRSDALKFSAQVSCFGGTAQYDGRTNTGLPLRTDTSESFIDALVEGERTLIDASSWRAGLLLAYGWQRWDRNIRAASTSSGISVSSLFERYQWQYVSVGATATARMQQSEIEFRAIALHTVGPRVTVEFNTGLDSVTLRQGTALGARASLNWRYPFTTRFAFLGSIHYEYYEFGRSATATLTRGGTPVGTLFEPRSETSNSSIRVGIELRL